MKANNKNPKAKGGNPTAVLGTPKVVRVRVYKAKGFKDRETVQTAINKHIQRARKQSELERHSVAVQYTSGSTFVAFNGTESLVLSHDELIDLVLEDKSLATQLRAALKAKSIPLSIAINNSNIGFSTEPSLQPPTIAECEATKIEDLKHISSTFYFKSLPHEVRKMVYLSSDAFALGHDGQVPPFYLVALCDNYLHDEAKDAYKKINFHVSLANEEIFNNMKAQQVQFLHHLYCQWAGLGVGEYEFRELTLHGNRCKLRNHLRTITMDFSKDKSMQQPNGFELMKHVACASSGVARLNVRLLPLAELEGTRAYDSDNGYKAAWYRKGLIETANEWIRCRGRLASVNTGNAAEEWFWEHDGGEFLDVSVYGRAHLKGIKPSVEGNLTLDDALLGRSRVVQ